MTSTVADLHSKILDARPPGGPNSFKFMQFLGKFGKIVCWRPLGEILGPPLINVIRFTLKEHMNYRHIFICDNFRDHDHVADQHTFFIPIFLEMT